MTTTFTETGSHAAAGETSEDRGEYYDTLCDKVASAVGKAATHFSESDTGIDQMLFTD